MREGERERGREGEREGGREGEREREREGERERGKEEERERGREGKRKRGREGKREGIPNWCMLIRQKMQIDRPHFYCNENDSSQSRTCCSGGREGRRHKLILSATTQPPSILCVRLRSHDVINAPDFLIFVCFGTLNPDSGKAWERDKSGGIFLTDENDVHQHSKHLVVTLEMESQK